MMNTRQSPRSTRIDLRLPNDLLETVQNLASERFKAPIHHISGKPEITPVIVQLIELGIGTLSGNDTDTDKNTDTRSEKSPDNYPDTIGILARLNALEDREEIDRLSETIAALDGTVAELYQAVNHQGQRAIAIAERVEALESGLEDVKLTTLTVGNATTALVNPTTSVLGTITPNSVLDKKSEGLNGNQFASVIGVDPSVVSRWKNGKRPIPDNIAEKWEIRGGRWYRK
jgi:hypothetical protein